MIWLLAAAWAKSWCAMPVAVHEWGVVKLAGDGTALEGVPFPDYYKRSATLARTTPTRTLPPDGGERTLPVVHFYGMSAYERDVPIGLEVGFSAGEAAAWYPAVDRWVPAEQANSEDALAHWEAREQALLEEDRSRPYTGRELGPDPRMQLIWDRLTLKRSAQPTVKEPGKPWVADARKVPSMWVEGQQTERFVFYEGATREVSALDVQHEGGSVVLTNTSAFDVHDAVWWDGSKGVIASRIPAGTRFEGKASLTRTELLAELRARWTDTSARTVEMSMDDCVMMRDPAKAVSRASSHRMYEEELDTLLGAWDSQLLQTEPQMVYREDAAAIDAAMPIALYTDMRHFLTLHRLSVVVQPKAIASD